MEKFLKEDIDQKPRIYEIKSVADFVDLSTWLYSSDNVIFRGQRKDWELLPSITHFKDHSALLNNEKETLEQFKRESIPYINCMPKNDWQWLALAQHYRLPTRLLDWTYSALAALWFTVKDTPCKNKNKTTENGVVWLLTPEVEDFRTDTEQYGPLSNKITKIFRPKVISRRISAQVSAFTVHKINKNGRVIRFENHAKFKKKLLKIIVPPEHFLRIRHSLNILGVNNATLFPDIDGLCSHLKWRYSYLDDEKQIKQTLTRRSSEHKKQRR